MWISRKLCHVGIVDYRLWVSSAVFFFFFFCGLLRGGVEIGVLIYDIGACSSQEDVGGSGDDGLSAFINWGVCCRFFGIEVALGSIFFFCELPCSGWYSRE